MIVRYLCATHRRGHVVARVAAGARFDAERWMDWQQTTLNPAGAQRIHPVDSHAGRASATRACSTQSIAATEPLFALLDAPARRRAVISAATR